MSIQKIAIIVISALLLVFAIGGGRKALKKRRADI